MNHARYNMSNIIMAWRILCHNRGRFALSIAGIAFAVLIMFMELGFANGFNDSQGYLPTRFNADLVILNKRKMPLMGSGRLHRSRLFQTLAFDEVIDAFPVYEGEMSLRNPDSKMIKEIEVIAFPAGKNPFFIPEVELYQEELKKTGIILFDSKSRKIYGNIRAGMDIELSDVKHRVAGFFKLGPNFIQNGFVIMSDSTWARLKGKNAIDKIDFGFIRVRQGADIKLLKTRIENLLAPDALVMTPEELRSREVDFCMREAPIGVAFAIGLIFGVCIGITICYQILFNEINDCLSQYAALKAMGFSKHFLRGIVMGKAAILSVIGFLPGLAASFLLYALIEHSTQIIMFLNIERIALIFFLTFLMCAVAGLLAVKRVVRTDPAEIF